jgi:hypothetical protein
MTAKLAGTLATLPELLDAITIYDPAWATPTFCRTNVAPVAPGRF